MAQSNPAVIAASLTDDELRKGIESLVTYVDKATKQMAQSFTDCVAKIKAELASISSTKIDLPSTSGRRRSRAQEVKEEGQAIKETTAAYDEMARAMQLAANSAFAKYQVSDVQRLRMEMHELERQISTMQTKMNGVSYTFSSPKLGTSQIFDVRNKENFTTVVDLIQNKIKELQSLNFRLVREGDIEQARRISGELAVWRRDLDRLQNRRSVWEKQQAGLEQLQAKLASVQEQYKAMGRAMEGAAQATAKANTMSAAAKPIVDEAKRVEEIKKAAEEQRQAFIQTGTTAQQTFQQIKQSMLEQIQSGSKGAIQGIQELDKAMKQMSTAYYSMTTSERESPLGRQLKADLEQAKRIRSIISEYNYRLLKDGGGAQGPSITHLSRELQQLTSDYKNLAESERESSKGKGLLEKIQATSAAVEELNKKLSRPVSLKSALAGEENSIDQMSRKIQRLSAYMRGLDTSNEKSRSEMQLVRAEIDRLRTKQRELLGENDKLINSNNTLARSWTYMKNRLAFYLTVGASTQFVRNLIDVRSQYELTEKALGILINSAERGTHIFGELSQMALVSPYTLIELSDAAKQLTAYDVEVKNVVDTTRRMADMAAAVGVPIQRLTYALGQIKAYGYLNARDARMFLNAGIPLVKQLSDYYTELEGRIVSVGDIYDRIKKKAIDYNDVMSVVTKMTDEGGKFFDFQAKMAETLKVQLANLTLAWNNMLNDIGKDNQALIATPIAMLKELFLHWQDINRVLTDAIWIIGTIKAAQILWTLAVGKGTMALLQQVGAIEGATAAEYRNALSKINLTKLQAKLLLQLNGSNKAFKQAIIDMEILSAAEVKAATSSRFLGVNLGFVTKSLKTVGLWIGAILQQIAKMIWSLITNPVFLTISAIMAVVDALNYYSQVAQKNEDLNKAIAEGAKEASEELSKFLKLETSIEANASAKTGNLSQKEAIKVWDTLRDEIEQTAISADTYIAKLMEIPDLNQRIVEGFKIAEEIEKATIQLRGLVNELEVSQDSWLWGAFGEGLAEDLEDYKEQADQYYKFIKNNQPDNIHTITWFTSQSRQEAKDEIKDFADDVATLIRERLGEEGVKSSIQVTEAIARIVKETEQAYPQIKGSGKALFEAYFDELMSKEFGENIYSKTTSIWASIMEQIKKDSSSTFASLTDNIMDENQRWSKDQEEAIRKAIEKVRNDLPVEFSSTLDEMMADLNSRDWKIHITTTFDTQVLDPIRKSQLEHFIGETSWAGLSGDELKKKQKEVEERQQRFTTLLRKQNEEDLDYEKRLQDEKKKTQGQIVRNTNALKAEDAATRKAAEEEKPLLEQRLKDIEAIQKFGNYKDKPRKGGRGSQKDPLADAIAKEIQLVSDIQKLYKEYRKAGMDATTALTLATQEYEKALANTNNELAKFGIKGLSGKELANMDNRKLREYYEGILGIASSKGTSKGVEALEKAIRNLNAEINKADAKKITDGLNNELAKVKDEYELAVELEATPELGDVFADMMGLSNEQLRKLPRTFNDVAEDLQQRIDKVFESNNVQAHFDLASMLNPNEFEKWVKQYGHLMDDNLTTALKAYVTYATKVRKDESKKTVNEWSSLTEKYGTFQTKMLKIAKETAQEQLVVVRKYGSEAEKADAFDLVKQIRISKDPTEVARLQQELTQLLENVVKNNPNGISITEAISNAQARQQAKTTWEDFRNSDLYSMTFEDMEYVSSRAIQAIIAKLDTLKGKVKDDPASMKALMKAYEDAEKELAKRNPFGSIITSLKKWAQASQDVKEAQLDLRLANQEVAFWEDQLSQAVRDGDTNKEAKATDKLAKARKKQASATLNLTNAENTEQKAQSKAVEAFNASSQALQNMGNALQQVTSLLGIVEDSEVGEAIKSITNGFQMMANTLSVVATMSTLAKTSMGWLGWAMASLSAVVGLFSWIIGAHDRKINKQIKESEKRVKRLENVYKELESTIKEAYGAAEVGAKRVAIANKELELAELERQLKLEESRRGKKYDEEKVIELKGKIIDLKNEIKQDTEDITNTLMGISDVGDAAETLVSAMIESFKEGEDYMGKYAESFEDMIDNMVMKAIVGKVVGERIQQMFDFVEANANARGQGYQAQIQAYQYQLQALDDQIIDAEHTIESMPAWKRPLDESKYKTLLEQLRKEREALMAKLVEAQGEYAQAVTPSPEDVFRARDMVGDWSAGVKEIFDAYMEAFGIKFGQNADANKNLSALQQGIQSITEDTAGAIEAYLNGVSQQVYLQSDLLTQIRDAVVGMGGDEALATNAQILLQLQQSFQVQVAIRNTMADWSNASGRAVRVELIS